MPVAKSTLKVRPQQQLSDKKLKEILEEDKRRLTSLLATYRPITGENAPGLRFECVIEDFLKGKKLWLPVEMLKEKKFCAIIKCGFANLKNSTFNIQHLTLLYITDASSKIHIKGTTSAATVR